MQPVAVALSPDGSKLYVAIFAQEIAIVDVPTGTTLKTVPKDPSASTTDMSCW